MRNGILLALVLALLTPVSAQNSPQHPARRYLIRGTVRSVSPTALTVQGYDRHEGKETSRTLRVVASSQVPDGLKVGDPVVADYNHTMENNVYELISVRRARGPKRRGSSP